jgi:hypothetical protein
MKGIIDRVFSRRPSSDPVATEHRHSAVSSELTNSDIEDYYLRIITDGIRRMLVTPDSVEIGVKPSGAGPGGLPAFAGYVRIVRWDPVLTPVLLQNMPLIDARIRKVVAASVILEHTHFAGLWFQATGQTAGAPTVLTGMPAELVRQPGGEPPRA